MDKSKSIVFHLDRDVLPIADMGVCVEEFFEMVKSASADCLTDIKWMAEIQHGSVALAVYPTSDTESDDDIDRCLGVIHDEFEVIHGGKAPNVFSEETLRHYSKLAGLFAAGKDKQTLPTLAVKAPSVPVDSPIEMSEYEKPTANASLSKSFGTAYGEVKSLSATRKPYFALYDEATKRRIKVFYDDSILDTVRECYRNNVRVTGDITFNPDGTKKFIDAREVEIVLAKEAPRLSSLFGILGDA